jgi:pyruvate dehydrogenase E1 component subunit alpha
MSKKSEGEKATGKVALNSRKLKQLFSTMLKCRMIQDRVRRVFPRRAAGDLGQDAAEVGAAVDLLRDDFIAPVGREFVFHFMKGGPLQSVFARLRALDAGVPSGVISPAGSVAERLSMATGAALAFKRHKQAKVALAFAADDPTSDDFPHHVLRFASRHKLPVVYVIQHAPAKNTRRNTQVSDYGMPSIMVDGNDVVAVYRVSQEAVRRAREGHGPALIHCHHLGSGDPLKLMENYLKRKRLWSDDWKNKMTSAFSRKLDTAVASAKRSR